MTDHVYKATGVGPLSHGEGGSRRRYYFFIQYQLKNPIITEVIYRSLKGPVEIKYSLIWAIN